MSIQSSIDSATRSLSSIGKAPSASDIRNQSGLAVQGLYEKALDDVLKETKLPYRKVITTQVRQRIAEQRKLIKSQKSNVLNKIKLKGGNANGKA